jgi:hypothetical protein
MGPKTVLKTKSLWAMKTFTFNKNKDSPKRYFSTRWHEQLPIAENALRIRSIIVIYDNLWLQMYGFNDQLSI